MTLSAFSYIRNGFKYGYPFLQSIQSILPICDEFVIAVGDSEDGTREAIEALNNPKIKIIDTIWDDDMRRSGKIFAQQANIALAATKGDWLFHIQADEVIHENDLPNILEALRDIHNKPSIDGLLFDFINFYGSYDYLNDTRYQHKKEIRIFRKGLGVWSYRDSQGFRKYPSYEEYLNGFKGVKLNVRRLRVPVYHYTNVRNPILMNEKEKRFVSYYHDDEYVNKKFASQSEFDYYNIERVKRFTGKHPAVMQEAISKVDWVFDPLKIHKKLSFKDKVVYFIEDIIKYRIGEYKNYKLVD